MSPYTVLVINSGSSSLKFSVIQMPEQHTLLTGLAEKLGLQDACIHFKHQGNKHTLLLDQGDHQTALNTLLQHLNQFDIDLGQIKVVGHRVVHGGETFSKPTLANDAALSAIEACNDLAPLHNPANLVGIKALQQLLPGVPQVAVFDTAFHQTLPAKAFRYATPRHWYQDFGVRKYGFHGTSHQYVAEQAIQTLGLDEKNGLLIAHLGNGCSATAICDGKSVDTTMGLTPLEGLVMGTRSGDLDPAIFQYISEKTGAGIEDINTQLNKASGLLGVSGLSSDMRTLIDAASKGDQDADLAIELFCYRLGKQLLGLCAGLQRLDALVFTGGIGENSPLIREKTSQYLTLLGIQIDSQKNNDNQLRIDSGTGPAVCVIATNEELQIALSCREFV